MEKKDDDTQEADELMMHEVVYLNEQKVKPSTFEVEQGMENLWYLENGASNHMSGNRLFFYKLDEGVTGMVRFGDDSRIEIKGKGSIKFVLKGGDKKVLSNVYYIPGLKSNIVSLGQATEAGCEVSMKDDILKLFDHAGQLMVKSTRSKTRLYKVVLQADTVQCLQIASCSESSKWHARLGHLNNETMKMMMNKSLVVGMPKITIERETCVSCLFGKLGSHSRSQRHIEQQHHLSLSMGTYAGLLHLPHQEESLMFSF